MNIVSIVFLIAVISNIGVMYYMANTNTYRGVFINYFDLIIIQAKGQTPQQIEIISIHESGHHVWHNYLNDSLRAEFENLSIKYRSNPVRRCIDGYVNTTKEDFADSYRQFEFRNYWAFDGCKDKLEFFKRVENMIIETGKPK